MRSTSTIGRPAYASRRACLVVATIAIGATACGSDDPEPLTKAEFVAQADAICAEGDAKTDALTDRFWADLESLDPDDPDDRNTLMNAFAAMVDEITPVMTQMAEDLRGLEPPREDRDLVRTLLDDYEAALDEINEVTDAAAAGDEAARQRLDADENDPFTDVNRRARDYGLTVCGQDG